MLNQIRPWVAAHPRWAITVLVTILLGPFLAKPFNIDDPLFIWLAHQVRAHPGDPFGFPVNWYGTVQPMWTVTENPPLAGYYFALAGSLFGWSEISLHLAAMLAALAVILGTYRLANRLSAHPMLAACACLFAPIFLVSANTVMCDVLMLAFWVWALVFWMEGLEQNHLQKIILAGLLVALALLTKYFGVALLPLLAVHGAMEKRKMGNWLIGLLIPMAVLGGYQWLTFALYGHPLFSTAASFATSAQTQLGFSKLAGGLIALAFIGGGAVSAIFLAPSLWRVRTLVIIGIGTALLGGAICSNGLFLNKYPALTTTTARTEVIAQLIFWMAGGVLVLVLAVCDVMRNVRDSRAWLLALWVGGTFFFAGFANWTVNGRSLLPLLPAVGILLARRWATNGMKHLPALYAGLAACAVLTVLVAQSDFQTAVAIRRSAEEASARCASNSNTNATVWFEGHWGFQYYMEKLGATAVDFKHGRQQWGDLLVVPKHNTDVSEPAHETAVRRDEINVPNPAGLTTWHADIGAGFYSSALGPLPFGFGKVPMETVYVYELKPASPK